MDRDDLWIVEHFSELVTKYAGKYVAVVNETLVAVGDSRRDVETKAREVEPEKIPSVLRVPREEDMVCLFPLVFRSALELVLTFSAARECLTNLRSALTIAPVRSPFNNSRLTLSEPLSP